MSQKFFAQSSEIVHAPSLSQANRRSIILIFIATILVLALAFVVFGQIPARDQAANINQTAVIPYSNALEMQYAQPHLNNTAASISIPFGDALALQYAQPYLNNTADSTSFLIGNALEMQYAHPWLTGSAGVSAGTNSYSNAMEMQYAQPWLTDAPTYGDALEMQYAQQYQGK